MRDDLCDLTGGDAAWAGGEDEADRVGSGIGGEERVFEAGVAADFDPEAHVKEWIQFGARRLQKGSTRERLFLRNGACGE